MPDPTAEQFAQACAEMRVGLLRYMREIAPVAWTHMIQTGVSFLMPPDWRRLPPAQAAKRLAQAEAERIAGGPLYALDAEATASFTALAPSMGIVLTPHELPAECGMLLFDAPLGIATDRSSPIRLVTWGRPPTGTGEGLWLSWYSDVHAGTRRQLEQGQIDPALARERLAGTGALLDQEVFLPFAPVVASHLAPGTSAVTEASRIQRAALAVLFALANGLVEWEEHQPSSALRTVLRKNGAKQAGVRIVGEADEAELRERIEAHNAAEAELAAWDAQTGEEQTPTPGEGPDVSWIARMRSAYQARLGNYEQQVAAAYPKLRGQLAMFESEFGAEQPEYAPLPIAAAMEVIRVGQGLRGRAIPANSHHAALVTALELWRRAGRTVHYVHPAVAADLDGAAVLAARPRDLLEQLKALPGRCVYLATSDADGVACSGFFVHLEHDENERRDEIRVVLDLDADALPGLDSLLAQPIHITGANLAEAVDATWSTTISRAAAAAPDQVAWPVTGPGTEHRAATARQATHLAPLLAAALFLLEPDAAVTEDADLPGAEPDSDGVRLALVTRAGQSQGL